MIYPLVLDLPLKGIPVAVTCRVLGFAVDDIDANLVPPPPTPLRLG